MSSALRHLLRPGKRFLPLRHQPRFRPAFLESYDAAAIICPALPLAPNLRLDIFDVALERGLAVVHTELGTLPPHLLIHAVPPEGRQLRPGIIPNVVIWFE